MSGANTSFCFKDTDGLTEILQVPVYGPQTVPQFIGTPIQLITADLTPQKPRNQILWGANLYFFFFLCRTLSSVYMFTVICVILHEEWFVQMPKTYFSYKKIGQFLNIYTDFTTLYRQKKKHFRTLQWFFLNHFRVLFKVCTPKSGTSQKCYFSASTVCLPVMSVILSATVWPAWQGANELDHGEITLTEIAWQLIVCFFPTHRRILAASGKFWQTPIRFFFMFVSAVESPWVS